MAGKSARAAAVAKLRLSKRHDGWKPEQMETFFDQLAESADVAASARAARMDVSALYRRRRTDEAFRLLWDGSVEEGVERLQAKALTAALSGIGAVIGGGDGDESKGGGKNEEADGKAPGKMSGKSEGRVDMASALKILAAHDAREKRRGATLITCMPIDEVEAILFRRLAAVEKRLAGGR